MSFSSSAPVIIHWNIPLWTRIIFAVSIMIIIYMILWYYDTKDEFMNKSKFELFTGR